MCVRLVADLHRNRLGWTCIDGFLDHAQFRIARLERVFSSLRRAARISQLDV